MATHLVGGDYFDVAEVTRHCWSAVVADVSGKGVSSALLASLLQGALLSATDNPDALGRRMDRLNRFMNDRTGGEKYATVFQCLLHHDGRLFYVNAAHCPPLLVRPDASLASLEATSMPVGLLIDARFESAQAKLQDRDKLVIYSDGVTESENTRGEFFGKQRLREVVSAHAGESCAAIHDAIVKAVAVFTEGAPQADDVTVLVLEYRA